MRAGAALAAAVRDPLAHISASRPGSASSAPGSPYGREGGLHHPSGYSLDLQRRSLRQEGVCGHAWTARQPLDADQGAAGPGPFSQACEVWFDH